MKKRIDHSERPVVYAVFGNLIVTLAKFLGWVFSLSPSMLAETIHSVADTFNQVLLYVGIRQGKGKPTPLFPHGKANARYLWNLISAVGILVFGFGYTFINSVSSIIQPNYDHHEKLTLLQPAILIFALFIESFTLHVAYDSVRKSLGDRTLTEFVLDNDDPTGLAVLLEDTLAVFGVILALVGIVLSRVLESPFPDAICSLFISVLIGILGLFLGVTNARLLMGVSAGYDRDNEIKEFIESFPSVERVVSLRTTILGPSRIRLAMELEFHGAILINRQQIERDSELIRQGEDPVLILYEASERMVRLVGREINRLEAEIHTRFPEIALIDLEVN